MRITHILTCAFALLILMPCVAALDITGIEEREAQRQRDLEEQRRRAREDASPDVRLTPEDLTEDLSYPENETPCFPIREIVLTGDGSEKFRWALKSVDDAVGRCLGARGVNVVMRRVQNRIVEAGYVTTRVVASPQDLRSGRLELTVVPGTVGIVKLSEDSGRHVWLRQTLPLRKGKHLNIRDVEQGLENLRRVPTVRTDIKLAPGDAPGVSDLIIKRTQSRPFRLTVGVDDSGSEYTGKYQGYATLSLDNVLGLSDLFYASVNRNMETGQDYGTNGYSFHYSIPWGYWQLAANSSYYQYHQVVAGQFVDYEYSGESQTTTLELSRIVHRTSISKTTLAAAGFFTTSKNYMDDTELEIQRRRMAGWEFGVSHRQHIGKTVLDADVRFRHGTGALSALPAPEEEVDEGTSRPSILTMNIRWQIPFKLGPLQFRYTPQWCQQFAFTKLIARDRFTIGGRYSVRGYTGDMTLSADNGFTFRNDLALALGRTGQEVYVGADFGRVWGPFSDYLLGQTLSGGALGLRGGYKGFSYDVFVSRPLNKPDRFPGERWVLGFSASLQY